MVCAMTDFESVVSHAHKQDWKKMDKGENHPTPSNLLFLRRIYLF